DFRRLRFLAMPNNSLSELPSLDANNIFRLNLNRNRFEEFPQSVTELPNLVSLMIDENFLTSMPDSIASSVMQAISAENNQLSTFPGFLEHQMQLHSADLSRNFIQEIPSWITHFTELEYLNLGWNQIRIVPEEIASLTRIRLLELQSNPLEDFDISCLYGLTNLGILNLEDTFSLTTIPEKIRAYRKLFDLKFVIKY
ncbi:MAG: leucine-rich repeat domain-containing protein, partial [Candidatus Kariarchaeaceae archaeon]